MTPTHHAIDEQGLMDWVTKPLLPAGPMMCRTNLKNGAFVETDRTGKLVIFCSGSVKLPNPYHNLKIAPAV